MEHMRESPLPPQIRAMQLELAQAKGRERDLEGQVKRLTKEIEDLHARETEDRVGPLNRRIQDLDREVFQAKQAADLARREARELAKTGAVEGQEELAKLREWKASQDKREHDRDLQLGLERQRVEATVRGLREQVDAQASALAKSEAQVRELQNKLSAPKGKRR